MTPKGERPERFVGHRFPQVIPDPDDVEAGALAPWASLPMSARSGFTLRAVQASLAREHRLLATSPFPDEPEELSVVADALPVPTTSRSAVLVALFEEAGETSIVLTRRALSLRHHGGEIALPGGRSESGETPVETALREAHEEIGLDPSAVTPLAWLSPIVSFASRSSIWPVVGLLSQRPTFTIDPGEVDRAFTVTLADLVADDAFIEERWRRALLRPGSDADGYFPIHFYKVPGDIVWGATARVLSELLSLVTNVPWPAERGPR
ncbi:MAG TPA: CoA pyrophosphatase [Acidimicrobiales bacterium]|jgi:8-oxo-dGTP pyrophosphatase MutT (NUDIX family)|nr:CoA pyrophosphatase [Acidimicrobiales bacterium]